jgi:pimeloyl-ACP methyl ester carboxylesterase
LINDISIGTIINEGYRTVKLTLSQTGNNIVECKYYKAEFTDSSKAAVIYVGGVGGGWDSPSKGLYPRLSQKLAKENGIDSLRIRFRYSTDLEESIVDVLAGIEFLTQEGITSIALVGHSFGGAVVISAASIASENIVKAVVPLDTQSYGTEIVSILKEDNCSILLIHGNNDKVLSLHCSHYVYNNAHEPKELVLYDNASHGLDEVADKIFQKVYEWLLKNLIK